MHLSTDLLLRAKYSQAAGIHRIVPEAVCQPTNEHELLEALSWARSRGLAVTPRGAGSAMDGSSVGEGLIVDMTRYDATAARFDSDSRAVWLSAAVTLGQLEAAAKPHGLRFGPDPSSSEWVSLGGVIGTNAAGPRSYSLGPVSSWVQSLRLVTSDGTLLLERGHDPDTNHPVVQRWHSDAEPVLAKHRDAVRSRWPRSRKNTAGYALDRYWKSGDLIDLVIGAEGTLGIVTEALVRLDRVPEYRATLRVLLEDREAVASAVTALTPVRPTAVELLDRSLLRFVSDEAVANHGPAIRTVGALLLVELEDHEPRALTSRVLLAQQSLSSIALSVETAESEAEAALLQHVRHSASATLSAIDDGRRSMQVVEDGCVPIERLSEYLNGVQRICDGAAIELAMFGHAGDGHVHVNLLPDTTQNGWLDRVSGVFEKVTKLVIELGGSPAGEHGAGRLRAGVLPQLLGPEAMECFVAIKRAFDPDCRFNPGVILADKYPAFERLKLGPNCHPLPAGVEAQLRSTEIERKWGENRWA
jgi:FAD/FMN-containing dehydrogenase